jgi:hypothetical protein
VVDAFKIETPMQKEHRRVSLLVLQKKVLGLAVTVNELEKCGCDLCVVMKPPASLLSVPTFCLQ